MKILHVFLTKLAIPPVKYGGTERVIWSLATAQREMGHEVRFMLKKNAGNLDGVYIYDENKPIKDQIDDWADMVHFHWPYDGELDIPFICTEHGNWDHDNTFPINTTFLTQNHASRYGADCYVYNGLDWSAYGSPNIAQPTPRFHYLAKAAWDVKNIKGAVEIAKKAKVTLDIMGGRRINVKRNKYLFLSSNLHFHGMVGGEKKAQLIKASSGLLFPVRWHEPFGLAIIESMYLGCPVFATPYGSLPEIVSQGNLGFLSTSYDDIAQHMQQLASFDRHACHEHAKKHFNHEVMAAGYQICYEKVLSGESLNNKRPQSFSAEKVLLDVEQ